MDCITDRLYDLILAEAKQVSCEIKVYRRAQYICQI